MEKLSIAAAIPSDECSIITIEKIEIRDTSCFSHKNSVN